MAQPTIEGTGKGTPGMGFGSDGSNWIAFLVDALGRLKVVSVAEAHASTHEDGGSDEISVAALSGELADDQPPKAHDLGGAKHNAATLAELNAKVSDATLDDSSASRTPSVHKTSHQNGGADELSVAGLSGVLGDKQDANKLQGYAIQDHAPEDGEVLEYVAATSRYEPTAPAAGDGNPATLDVTTPEVTVQNTATETNIYQESIPGGTLGTNNVLRLEIPFKVDCSGGGGSVTVRLKYGATTLATAVCTLGERGPFYGILNFRTKGNGATNSQFGIISGLAALAAVSAHLEEQRVFWGDDGTSAEDSTGALNLTVTVEFSVANAGNIFIMRMAILEKITNV